MSKDDLTGIGAHIRTGDVEVEKVKNTEGIFIQWLVSSKEGSDGIHLRRFVMEPGARMPSHRHSNCEHVQYYLQGTVKVNMEDEELTAVKGDAVFIPSGVTHSYHNIGREEAVFLCIVPTENIETEMME